MEDRYIKSFVLENFYEFFPNLPQAMRECFHSDGDEVHPFHMENDVWSHTMMTYVQLDLQGLTEREKLASCMTVLCHDVGKIYTRKKISNNRISFFGHASGGIQVAIDFCFKMFKGEELNWFLRVVPHCVAIHYDVYQVKDIGKFVNYDENILNVTKRMCVADEQGMLRASEKVNELKGCDKVGSYFLPRNVENGKMSDIKIIVLSGLPGSGKDYVAKEFLGATDDTIISFDKLRIEYYRKNSYYVEYGVTPDVEYHLAWEFCNKKKVDLLGLLKEKILDLRTKYGYNSFYISNTNLSISGRRKLVNVLKYLSLKDIVLEIGCIRIFTSVEKCVIRDKKRINDKIVGELVIQKFIKKQTLPTLLEGFDWIEYFINE